MPRKMIVGGLMVVALAYLPGSGEAGVNVNINLTAPPAFQVVPGTPVQYAPAVPTNYFLYGGRYYVFTDGTWFVAPRYNGPWAVVAPAYVPRPILTVPVRYYHVPPGHWKNWKRDAPPKWSKSYGHSGKGKGDHHGG
jgi:hypothetical protein